MIDENLKTSIKNSFYGFYQEYDAFKHLSTSPLNSEVDHMLEKYNGIYHEILISCHAKLPKELECDIQDLTYSIANVLNSIRSIETNLLSLVSVCADTALEIYDKFDNYFNESQQAS